MLIVFNGWKIIFKNKEADWAPPSVKGSKSEIIDYINKAYADVTSTIKGVEKLTDAQINGVYAIIDHSTHHRGQAVTYLRCNHIDPPEYVFWRKNFKQPEENLGLLFSTC